MNTSAKTDERFLTAQFPRAPADHPEWVVAGASGGANPLWVTECLSQKLELRPNMRVLDLGCGRALSSIFLHRELGVLVWATDLWFSASENLQRIRDAGAGDGVFPIHADARVLPFAAGFFDAIVSVDSWPRNRWMELEFRPSNFSPNCTPVAKDHYLGASATTISFQ